jgi:spermidine/putrescine transport system permease protein
MKKTSNLKSKNKSFPFLSIYGTLVYFYLYFPLLVVFVYSLNSSRSTMKFEGITFDWYMKLFQNKELLNSLFHSLQVSGLAVLFAVVMGTSGALFLNRIEFKGKDFFRTLAMLPIILPGIIVGLSLLIFFSQFEATVINVDRHPWAYELYYTSRYVSGLSSLSTSF